MTERFAIYYAPATADPLWERAADWLGRDAATGAQGTASIPGVDPEQLWDLTTSARRYGFHATLKPPMTLADGTSEGGLLRTLADFCAVRRPVGLGSLRLALLDGFLALMPEVQSDDLTAFGSDCVVHFDRFRAPLDAEERARRLQGGLTERQVELLDTYGYPYVLEQFRFHMTLTDRLPDENRDDVVAAARDWFAPVLDRPYSVDRVVLFHEARPGAGFVRHTEVALGTRVGADA